MNYKTSIADNITEKEIAEKLGISLSTVKRSVSRLKNNKNLIDKVISNNVIAEGSYKTYNKYHVEKCNENFFYIYNSFFNDDMNIAKASERINVKNFLLKIKAICKKETNKYISENPYLDGLNKTELSKKLGIDTKTLDKYLKIAVNAGQIKYITNGLLILNKSIIPDFKKDDTDTRIYHIIYDWCIDNGVVPPDRNDEITVMEDGSVRRRNSLLIEIAGKLDYMKDEEIRSLLTNRITSEEITLEYIAKVLNIKTKKKKEDIQYSVMLD
ncbi:winged helix-turn-helix transcriptional regulator [Bacteroides sp. AM07-18]|uniref:Winged helix-turn-helix transcriptional regulator n=1 Tax=Bacteroides uniformis TaxID=820 RepID=A0A374MZH3_BACUN|nr:MULTISPECIES: winged helix-turn-helix transcriptional regulator [Bacteroides]RGD52731.1 winged helix-turn-helix transcriptional regulator [Bacteroides sp. AM07-18]RJU29954.1 winged helix-turn-helix transcriptional regulator [Bacteroides sp. AM51-7]RJU75073.1 winged helix-turn-helix transcriptional regulator [Bacteroides sp. AM26-2]MBV4216136.1 winged helix-turn-helix transcriptional regulator [Bacteroides uniformis]MBV4230193.1 winged helix-turn-helix transcriptional regulator [Bacteroides 